MAKERVKIKCDYSPGSSASRDCEGTGRIIESERVDCPKCDGDGYTIGIFSGREKTCTNCEGTGRIIKCIRKECPRCEGKGYYYDWEYNHD